MLGLAFFFIIVGAVGFSLCRLLCQDPLFMLRLILLSAVERIFTLTSWPSFKTAPGCLILWVLIWEI